jgi:hypothetical protein
MIKIVKAASPMPDHMAKTIERLEALAAWHRAVAERAGSAWVWEARLKTAENRECQAADIRARHFQETGRSIP